MIFPFVAADVSARPLTCVIDSPIGELQLTGDGRALTGLYMLGGRGLPPEADYQPAPDAFKDASAQLEAYFAGELTEFDLPLAPSGTAFQLAVWGELAKIPYGVTISYGDIARALGKRPVAARAVGSANGSNPIAVIIPCHRVIGADGGLTGYGGGLDRKLTLLSLEGAAGLW